MRSFWIMRPGLAVALLLSFVLAASLPLATVAQTAPPRVVATIKPLHSLVAQVMGDTGKPGLIVDGTASPHMYALKPSDAKMLNGATVVFRVSDALEPFTAKILKSLPKSVRVVSLEQAPGVKRLARRSGGAFETHVTPNGTAAHGHSHARPASGATDADGHIWLDPANATAMVDDIANVLAELDAPRAATYRANADKAKVAIGLLAAEIDLDLKPLAERPYVVFHDAYQYFENRYGLSPVGSITTNPDVPPSGKRLADIRKKLASLAAACVFSEPTFDSRVVQAVTEGTSAKSGKLDPEGTMLPAGPELYAALMRQLSAGFKSCLSPPA